MDKIANIINGCVSGKRKSQEELYHRFSGKMFGVCLRYSKNHDEAEDVLQEGFIKVFTHIKNFRFKGSFEGWIRKIMVNTALERYRKQNPLYLVENMIDLSGNEHDENVYSEFSTNELLKIIQSLSPQYKVVFNLYAIEGYSHKEISEMLGISEGTSKSNLCRARMILQEKVKKYNASPYSQIS